MTFTESYEGLHEYMASHSGAGALVNELSRSWLGTFGGVLAVLGVIAAPITTGDTALRSARLMVADFLKFDQRKIWKRIAVTAPIFILVFLIMSIDFSVLWRYFAWSNQTLAVFTLWAVTCYLARKKLPYIISLLPAIFMTVVSVSYLMYAPRPEGLGLSLVLSLSAAIAVAAVLTFIFYRKVLK